MFPEWAQTIIQTHQQTAPIGVVSLANALGLRVWQSPMPDGISGKLFKDAEHGGSSGFAVFVNSREHENRRRFTVAHEIGHFLLHRDRLTEGEIIDDTFYRSRLSNRLEAEANRAAAEILMPWHLLNKLTQFGNADPEDLARSLKVSETALRIRLGLPT